MNNRGLSVLCASRRCSVGVRLELSNRRDVSPSPPMVIAP